MLQENDTVKTGTRIHLIEERKRHQWSQQEVADRLGTTRNNVSRWEQGVTTPHSYFREKLCTLFRKSAEELGLLANDPSLEAHPLETALPRSFSHGPSGLWSVPYPRNPCFTGREEILSKLQETLTTRQTAALSQVQALSGLGGIGKTQTAVEYLFRSLDKYQAILWIKADTRETLESSVADCARLLKLPMPDDQDPQRIVDIVKRWLQEHKDWLLLFDNVEDLGMVAAMLPMPCHGHVILTTRLQATGTLAQCIHLESMEPEEGAKLLLRRAKLLPPDIPLLDAPKELRATAKEISRLLGGLPLALDQAGAYVEETGCHLSDYLHLFQIRRAELMQRRGGRPSDHPVPVSTTWSLSFEQIEQTNRAAADLLRVCAFLHPDAIPQELLTEGAVHLGPHLGPVAADPLGLNEVISALLAYSLIHRQIEEQMFTIHRLVQAALRDRMDQTTSHDWANRVVEAVNH